MPRKGRGGGMNKAMTAQDTSTHMPDGVSPFGEGDEPAGGGTPSFPTGGGGMPAGGGTPLGTPDGGGPPAGGEAGPPPEEGPGGGDPLAQALEAAQSGGGIGGGLQGLEGPGQGGDLLSRGSQILPDDPYQSLRALYSVFPHPDILDLIDRGYDSRHMRS